MSYLCAYRLTYRSSASRSTSDNVSPRESATALACRQSASLARKLRSVVPTGISEAHPASAARGAVVGLERAVLLAHLHGRPRGLHGGDRGEGVVVHSDSAGGDCGVRVVVHVPTVTPLYLQVKGL